MCACARAGGTVCECAPSLPQEWPGRHTPPAVTRCESLLTLIVTALSDLVAHGAQLAHTDTSAACIPGADSVSGVVRAAGREGRALTRARLKALEGQWEAMDVCRRQLEAAARVCEGVAVLSCPRALGDALEAARIALLLVPPVDEPTVASPYVALGTSDPRAAVGCGWVCVFQEV